MLVTHYDVQIKTQQENSLDTLEKPIKVDRLLNCITMQVFLIYFFTFLSHFSTKTNNKCILFEDFSNFPI